MLSVSMRSIRHLFFFLFASGLIAGAGICSAQIPNFGGGGAGAEPFKLSAKFQSYEGSNKGVITVTATIESPWHIYSITQPVGGPKASELVIEESDKFKIGEFEADTEPHTKTEDGFNVESEYHEDTVSWTAPVEFTKGTKVEELKIEVTYFGQRCAESLGCVPIRGEEVVASFDGEIKTIDNAPLQIDGSHLLISGKLTRKSDGKLKPGDTAFVEVTLEPVDGYHVYQYSAMPKEEVTEKMTLMAITGPGKWAVSPVETRRPAADKVKTKDGHEHYEAAVTFKMPFTIPKDAEAKEYTIKGVSGFMTCDATGCTAPKGLKWEVTVPVGVDSSASPNLRITEKEISYDDIGKTVKKVNSKIVKDAGE